MICPDCGAGMVGITIQDAQMNEEYNERYKDGRFHY